MAELHTDDTTSSATASPFFRLPLELREAIYHYVLGHQTIHIIRQFCSSRHGDLGATICRLPSNDWDDAYALSQSSGRDHRGLFKPESQGNIRNHTSKHLDCSEVAKGPATGINLLHVCRQFYRDTSTMPYSTSTFWFNDEFAMETFVMEALTERQREAITHIQVGLSVRAGMKFARCLQSMSNLKRLELNVAYLNGDLFTPWLQAGAVEADDDEEFPVKLGARVQVIAGFDKAGQIDLGRASRRRVAVRLEDFLQGRPVDDAADVSKGSGDRSMSTWRFLLRNGCSI
ncbi:hypothetical protein AC578_10618 [Pseudocercospora eumusae]|uniref:DUF7730 domain-containing protein n=1 Tax=Pseudocercospora eumusae TaxID=321146 RepID=A0A139HKK5_9PEZI|nr:hypothetical protein AC578_10618 [Pseudocercospora eumusae]